MNEQLLGAIGPKIEKVENKKNEYKYLFGNFGVVYKLMDEKYRWKNDKWQIRQRETVLGI